MHLSLDLCAWDNVRGANVIYRWNRNVSEIREAVDTCVVTS